jgi:hypothetical protein
MQQGRGRTPKLKEATRGYLAAGNESDWQIVRRRWLPWRGRVTGSSAMHVPKSS